jgi:hypothetical protein
MNTLTRRFLAATALVACTAVAQARIDRTIEKTFTVNGTGTLKVSTQGGGIKVLPSNDSAVKITVKQKIKADTEAEADEILKKLELVLEQSGNDVTASAKYEKAPSGFRWGSWPPVNVDFVITVPAAFATDLNTSGGGITLGDLNGKVRARTSGGAISLGKIGAVVDAHTSGGPITLESASGDVNLDTSGGNITVGRVDGSAELSTSGGGIKIESVVNTLRAHTSGGSIRAGIVGPLQDDCSLSTSGGGVSVTIDKSIGFKLDASTSGGSVEADGLTITLEKSNRNRSRLAGSVNGGGPMLKLRSSGGDIVVRTR